MHERQEAWNISHREYNWERQSVRNLLSVSDMFIGLCRIPFDYKIYSVFFVPVMYFGRWVA